MHRQPPTRKGADPRSGWTRLRVPRGGELFDHGEECRRQLAVVGAVEVGKPATRR
ncbi:MAG: hypothetical protein ACRDQI_13575 [Pseudonocardiaceae bacterium]